MQATSFSATAAQGLARPKAEAVSRPQPAWVQRLLASYIAWAERSHERLRGRCAIG
jgi:hypothetical protein